MRTKRVKAALIAELLLTGLAGYALADTAVTVVPSAISYTSITHEISIGWRFFVDKTITITDLGLFDSPGNGSGLLGTHTVAIWRLPKTGGFELKRQVTIGPGSTLSDNHAWATLTEPLTISPDPVPYVLNGVEYYEKWMVGVFTPSYLDDLPTTTEGDALIFSGDGAVTFEIEDAGIIRFDSYTAADPASSFTPPWPAVPTGSGYYGCAIGVNFKYAVPGPTANAGDDVVIYSSEQSVTVINGSATHTVPGTGMTYQWLEGATVLGSGDVNSVDGSAPLSLASPVPTLSLGAHTLTLQVTDGTYSSADSMVLTLENTPAEGQVAPTYQVAEIGVDAIIITGDVADFDGDIVTYQWVMDGAVLDSGTVPAPAGGAVAAIEDLCIAAGDSRFPLGTHQVDLVVSDGVNASSTVSATVVVKDSTAPTVAPTASTTLLWPPFHQLVPVTIWANAADNGGGVITLSVDVATDEEECHWCHRRCGRHCSHWTVADWYVDSIDNDTGAIHLRLRAERWPWGDGRVYTVTVTGTDESGNSSAGTVEIRVPHDKRRR